jgi:hypothetical protein
MSIDKKVPVSKNGDTLNFWQGQISTAKKYLKDYHNRGDKIECRYRDEERNTSHKQITSDNFAASYNILYSNTETIQPILFSETPQPDVRASDTDSMNARKAAKMLEDVIAYNGKLPETISSIESAVKDLLLPGTGVLRVMYDPTYEKKEREDVNDDGEVVIEQDEKIVFEEVRYVHVPWKDLLYPKCKKWEALPWIAFRGLFTYTEAKEEFGTSIANTLEYTYQDESDKTNTDTPKNNKFGNAEVWEVWDKTNRRVLWIANGKAVNSPLRIDEDPLKLDEFYPIPKPLFSCTTTGEIKPVPLFVFYQDQANELDEVCTRLRRNINNLKRRGVYDGSFSDLGQLSSAQDNQFIPIKDFSKLQSKGGIKSVMDTEDLSNQIAVIESLYKQKEEIIQSIYQIMGIADILRGQSDPRETLGAQRIKGRFGTLRISKYQREVQRFIRDAFRIAGQIIVNEFEPKTIALQTSVPIDEVKIFKEILEQTEPASVLVDIQTDSTIADDDIADKQDIIEFTAAVSDFVERTPAMIQVLGLQATSDLLMAMLKKFKMGRDIEQAVMDRVKEAAKQAKDPKQPSPEQMKEQREMAKLQLDATFRQAELRLKDKELDIRAAEAGMKDTREGQKLDLKGVELAVKSLSEAQKVEQEERKLQAEEANPQDNAIVGV